MNLGANRKIAVKSEEDGGVKTAAGDRSGAQPVGLPTERQRARRAPTAARRRAAQRLISRRSSAFTNWIATRDGSSAWVEVGSARPFGSLSSTETLRLSHLPSSPFPRRRHPRQRSEPPRRRGRRRALIIDAIEVHGILPPSLHRIPMTDTPKPPATPNDSATKSPIEYGERVTLEDRAILDAIHAELDDPSTSAERREDLQWAINGFADKYCFDWLWEEPELRDHPDNPLYKGKVEPG